MEVTLIPVLVGVKPKMGFLNYTVNKVRRYDIESPSRREIFPAGGLTEGIKNPTYRVSPGAGMQEKTPRGVDARFEERAAGGREKDREELQVTGKGRSQESKDRM